MHGNDMKDILYATKLAYITKAEREATAYAELMKKKMDRNKHQKKRRRSSKEKLMMLFGMKCKGQQVHVPPGQNKQRTPTAILKSIR